MRKPTNSAMGTVSRMRWPRPTVSRYCAQSGIRDVISLLVKVPDKRSVDRLECWVWDQVYKLNAIPVLSLAMCMVIDVVFPVSEKRCHQSCWVGALVANLLAALGVARLRVASQCVHPPRWACRVLRMLPPRWLQGTSDPSGPLVSRIRDACSVRFPASGIGASIVYVLAGHSGVYVGKARLDRKKMCGMGPRALEHLRALLYTNVRDGMKPRYRILRRSLGSVIMLPAFWCDSEERALAMESLLIKLESPECNLVDRYGNENAEKCKCKGVRKRPSSWLRRSRVSSTSIWSYRSVRRLVEPCVRPRPCWEANFPGALSLALPFKHLFSLHIRETFAKEGVIGPLTLVEWKLMIMYLCGVRPTLCSPPWYRDSLAKFWYFVADHVDEFVVRPAQRAAVRKNVDFFLRRLQLPALSIPLLVLPGEIRLLRKRRWVLSSVKVALQAMRCRPARAWIVRHLRLSFGKRGVWADCVNAKRTCRDAVVQIDQRAGVGDLSAPAPMGLSRLPGAWRLKKWPVPEELSRKLCRLWDRWSMCLGASDRVRFKGRNALQCGLFQSYFPDAPPEWNVLQSSMELVAPDLKGKAVIGDDKDHSKIWVADQVDLSSYVAECAELDQAWARRDDLRPRDVSVWLTAREIWGLPAWLRRGRLVTAGSVKFPTVFPLVKGK